MWVYVTRRCVFSNIVLIDCAFYEFYALSSSHGVMFSYDSEYGRNGKVGFDVKFSNPSFRYTFASGLKKCYPRSRFSSCHHECANAT